LRLRARRRDGERAAFADAADALVLTITHYGKKKE